MHWEAVKRVFRYLAGTKELALTYGGEHFDLLGYTDADGASQEHRHAISGHAFLVDGGVVSWSSRKQELVTLSTAEAEYVAATRAAKEAIWLRRLVGDLFPFLLTRTILYCDNQAALKLAMDDNYHARTKHISICYHFIREVAVSGIYAALERLEQRGMVVAELGEASPQRGGRAKTYFQVTAQGMREVQAAKRAFSSLWDGLPSMSGKIA